MIVMSMKWKNITKAQYEKVRKMVDWEGKHPTGAVFHVAGVADDGLRVTDIWKTEKDFAAFAEKRLMPAVIQLGVTSKPIVEIYPMHAVFNPGVKKV